MGGGLHAVWMTVYVHFGGSRVLCVAMPVLMGGDGRNDGLWRYFIIERYLL